MALDVQNENEVPGRTKAKFDQLLQQAMSDNGQKERKGKKKKRNQEVLESLRKGEGIRKDEEDKVLLGNIYDPDNDVKGKSNKRVQKEREQAVVALEDETSNNKEIKKKKKKKKEINTEDTAVDSPAIKEDKIEAEPVVDTPVKKKKKKKKKVDEDTDKRVEEASGEELENYDQHTADVAEPTAEKPKTKRKKKKKQGAVVESPAESTDDVLSDEAAEEARPGPIPDDSRILSVTIHRTDKLKTDFFTAHPLVRVHVIDLTTGQYVKKQTEGRPVTSFYEADNSNVDFVQPIMTQPYDFKKHKSTLPVWEESVIFNENFNYFVTEEPRVALLFELMDFVSMNTAGQKYSRVKQEGGWHKIAWAFLKLCGANGEVNTNRKVRLQLYQPPNRYQSRSTAPQIYQWYQSSMGRTPYPSTLYVTVKGIIPPDTVEPAARSMFATQEERGKFTYEDLIGTVPSGMVSRDGGGTYRARDPDAWSRLPGQPCKVPNCLSLVLPAARHGCSVLAFSRDGKHLAAACHDTDGYPILVYEIPSGKLKATLQGHFSIIYELDWSKNDCDILSVSSDGTARVWNAKSYSNTPRKVLPHPTFVYTGKFHVRVARVVVTGGYDRLVRVWTLDTEDTQAQLLQELESHPSHINSLCFNEEGSKLHSVDSTGFVCIWNVFTTDQPSKNGVLKDWSLCNKLQDPEYKNTSVNYALLHPNNQRILLSCQDNTMRMIDLRINAIMQRFHGALHFREHVRSAVSPCGSFVLSGSEDCCAYVWNSETGDQVAMYTELGYKHSVTDVAFHPHEHMVAFCALGENHPVLIYKYDHNIAQRDVGLSVFTGTMRRTGRPASPTLQSTAVPFTVEDESLFESNTFGASTTQMDTRMSNMSRLERVTKKLDSVSAFSSMVGGPEALPGAPTPRDGGGTAGWSTGGWGSTFDGTSMLGGTNPRATSPVQRAVSPQHMASHNRYLEEGGSSWRPGFSALGRSGSYRSKSPGPMHPGLPPTLQLQASSGKPQFSFKSTGGGKQWIEKVVAMYDYQASRSDELDLEQGCEVRVLYKDSDNWWMGELADGRQGFFPPNYCTSEKDNPMSQERDVLREYQADSRFQMTSNAEDTEEEQVMSSRLTAVKTKLGELKFLSGTEESDLDSPKKTGTRKKKGSKQPLISSGNELDSSSNHPRRKKKSKKKIEESEA